MKCNLHTIYSQFEIYGDFVEGVSYGSGHINDSFAVTANQAGTNIRYLFQRINQTVFKPPEQLMDNIRRICSHLQRKLIEAGQPDSSRKALTTIPSRSGNPFYQDDDGNYWRCYLFVEGTLGYDIIENEEQAYQAAWAFGEFQKLLIDLPGKKLFETISDFHNTYKRL